MVVIAIAAILSSIAIVYSSQGRNQIALSVEAVKESQLILQAKQLAVATYDKTVSGYPACGYGMYFNIPSSTYSLFVYSPSSTRATGGFCPTYASTSAITFNPTTDAFPYSPQSWQVSVSQGVVMRDESSSGEDGYPSAVAVIFLPPNPNTILTSVKDGGNFGTTTEYVDLATADGDATRTISITSAGQVTF